jgi:uncharacterized coiled-coil DUF342 family protein
MENLKELNEIENLKVKIHEINEKISNLINEKNKIIEEKNKYLQTLKILKSEVYQLKIGKNNLNERIKKIIEEIRLTKKSLLEDINKIKELKINIKSLSKPNLTIENIKKRIEKNEWIIQTELLTPFEEKKIYEEIKKLEKLLIDAEKIREMNNVINNKKEIINKNALELQKLKEKRNKIFNELKPLLENYKNIKNEINILSEKYNEIKNKHRFLEAEKILLNSKLMELMYKIKSKNEEELKKKEAEIKKKIKEEALMKIKNGKKLTFEEFKILFEDQESVIK